MIHQLAAKRPLLESYLQSLSSDGPGAIPMDDAYFLSQVNFQHEFGNAYSTRHGAQRFIFGGSASSRRLRISGGRSLDMNADGFLDMFFVDIEGFYPDTYDLTYQGMGMVNQTQCLVFSVAPREKADASRFTGRIWVETAGFKIVRVKGTFDPMGAPSHSLLPAQLKSGFYFRFDSYRQMVSPDVWLPATVYFEENQQDKYSPPDIHIRGNSFMWGYGSMSVSHFRAGAASADDLSHEPLLASPGPIERRLDGIVQEIMGANHLSGPDIRCRVLLTTPLELFAQGNTIILSRGLLDVVPDDSVLTGLLAHEIAHVRLGESFARSEASERNRFDWSEGGDLASTESGSATQEAEVANLTAKLLGNVRANGLVERVRDFALRLNAQVTQTPNLLLARQGTSLSDHGLMVLPAQSSDLQANGGLAPIRFQASYVINVRDDRIREMPEQDWPSISRADRTGGADSRSSVATR